MLGGQSLNQKFNQIGPLSRPRLNALPEILPLDRCRLVNRLDLNQSVVKRGNLQNNWKVSSGKGRALRGGEPTENSEDKPTDCYGR